MNNLEINQEKKGDEVIVKCSGRLDASRSGHLNDYIDHLVREGQYHITLDLSGIEYLSSAGIRSLVSQYKNLAAINGYFYIQSMSENVNQVLNMVGMAEMLCQMPDRKVQKEVEPDDSDFWTDHQFEFKKIMLSEEVKPTPVHAYGKPELISHSGFEEKHARIVQTSDNHYAIGLGAIGNSFEDSKSRFGEYITLGKNIAYLPADGSKKPDYMTSSGQLIASLNELYGIHFEGNFALQIRFEPQSPQSSIELSSLAESLLKHTGYNQIGLVMIAESAGLIGTSLNVPPIEGKPVFTYPEIKETVNFTTEPAHYKMLTLSVGIFSSEQNEMSKTFLRPAKTGSSVSVHIHSAIFPYIPLKKTNIDLDETVEALFEASELTDILHLTNDNREISGLGESRFVQGSCWIVPLDKSIVTTK